MSLCGYCGIDVGEPDIGDLSTGGTPWAVGVVLCDKCYAVACENEKIQSSNPATDITDYDYSDTIEPNPYAVIHKVVNMINDVKAGNKISCINCSKDHYIFRTGIYGDFIYCPTCKTSTSRSTVIRKLCERSTKGYV